MAVKKKATGALTAKARNKLPKASFAIPSTKSYPIPDLGHAKNALARVSANGTPAQKKQVKAAVKKKFGVKHFPSLQTKGK